LGSPAAVEPRASARMRPGLHDPCLYFCDALVREMHLPRRQLRGLPEPAGNLQRHLRGHQHLRSDLLL